MIICILTLQQTKLEEYEHRKQFSSGKSENRHRRKVCIPATGSDSHTSKSSVSSTPEPENQVWRDCEAVLSPRRLQVGAENLHDTLFLLYYDMLIMLLHTMTQNISHFSSFVSSLGYVSLEIVCRFLYAWSLESLSVSLSCN